MQRQHVYQDSALTNVSKKFTNTEAGFIADKLFPILEVDKESGVYYVYDKSNLRREDSRQQGTGRANRISWEMTESPYGPLTKHQLEADIPYDILRLQDSPLDARVDATEAVTEKILIGKEIDLATTLADTTVLTQSVTLSGTSQWNDYSNSDPFANLMTAQMSMMENGILAPNTLVLGAQVWAQLANHPDLIERVKYSTLGVLQPDDLKALFPGIQNVLIGSAVYNNSDEGASDALDFIWGKHAWLAHVTPRPGIRQVSAGYTLTLRDARKVERWDEPWNNAEFVRVQDYYEQKLVAAEAMYLIKNAVA